MRHDLELDQDLAFQHRQWRVERICWLIIALLLVAALMGLFGRQPLARVSDHTSDRRLSIHYDRYVRSENNVEFLLTVEPQDGAGIVRLWFDPEYLDAVKIVAVSPVPLRGEARDGGRALVFHTDGSRFTASLSVQFESAGFLHGRMWVDEGPPLTLSHLVWP